jgi:hypothetical protein
MEMIYLMTKGDFLQIDKVIAMSAGQFLYLSEYLLRKQALESKENK